MYYIVFAKHIRRSRSPGTRNTTAAPTSPSSQSHHSRHTLAQSLTSAGGASASASVVTAGLNAGGSVTSNRRSVAGGSINPRGRKTSPVRGRTTQGARSEGPSEPVEKEAEDASFTFDIVKFKCRIQVKIILICACLLCKAIQNLH